MLLLIEGFCYDQKVKPKQLERKLTLASEFGDLFIAAVPLIFLTSIAEQIGGGIAVFLITVVIMWGTIGWLVYRYVGFEHQLAKHELGLTNLATANKWQLQTNQNEFLLLPELENVSLMLIANRDAKLVNYMLTPAWNYIDLSYCIYRKSKNGEYKAAYVYYSVLVTKLPRVLPNVFFDSKSQGGRQYKAKFTKDQRHGLEGDFDTYFDTYFAEGYTIDSMSFITPDVMQALEAASNYDIEIMGDRLLMYGPVYVDASEILDGATKLQAILKTLQFTASEYDDERLPGDVGRQTVTPEGFQLRRKSSRAWISIIFIAAYIILRLGGLIFASKK